MIRQLAYYKSSSIVISITQIYSISCVPPQMVDLLISALKCLAKLSQEVSSCPLSKSAPSITYITTETSLRLVNHCWEQLTQVCGEVVTFMCVMLPAFLEYALFQLIRLLSANESSMIICSNGILFNVL